MAHFYGILQGGRGRATRCGTRTSGMETTAASWEGAVSVSLYERDGCDYARVKLTPWHGRGTSRVLYDGPVSGAATVRDDESPVGTCPACGELVYASREGDGGPVWTCPADLAETNPFHEPPLHNWTEADRERMGYYGNCLADTGDDPCYEPLPLHGACYERGFPGTGFAGRAMPG